MQETAMPIARNSDPTTSHEAAAESPIRHLAELAYAACKTLQAIHGDATAVEAAEYATSVLWCRAESVRKRFGELEAEGRVMKVCTRKCRVTGREAAAYRCQ
jgi:hypothetical protein